MEKKTWKRKSCTPTPTPPHMSCGSILASYFTTFLTGHLTISLSNSLIIFIKFSATNFHLGPIVIVFFWNKDQLVCPNSVLLQLRSYCRAINHQVQREVCFSHWFWRRRVGLWSSWAQHQSRRDPSLTEDGISARI